MSITHVRPYFQARMKTLNFSEWPEQMNIESIPKTRLKSVYGLETLSVVGISRNQYHQLLEMPVKLTYHINACKNQADAVTSCLTQGEAIIKECVKPSNANTQTSIKNVVFSNLSVDPIADSNDNSVRGIIDFTVTLVIDPS